MSDPRRPDFKISIGGSPISKDLIARVIQINIDDTLDRASLARVRFKCQVMGDDADTGDASTFKVGGELKIELGYVGKTTEVFLGEITGLKGAFPRRANPTLTVIAMDKVHRLRRSTCQATFLEQKDSEAISTAAQSAGLTAEVDSTDMKQSNIQQFNKTAADFILERAKLCGMEMKLEDGKLKVKKPDLDAGPAATITWRKELQHFAVAISIANQQTELETRAWDMSKKEMVKHKVKSGDEPSKMGGTKTGADQVKALSQPPTVYPNVPCSNQTEVEQFAKAMFNERSQDFVTGEGTCEGNPDIRGGTVVSVEGIGSYLEGPYYVTQAIHSLLMDTGYTTTFRVRRTALQAPATVPADTAQVEAPPPEPFEVTPDHDPLSFAVQDPKTAPLGGVPFVLTSPDGKRKPGELSSDGKVEVDFKED